jgi:hypothetical protein
MCYDALAENIFDNLNLSASSNISQNIQLTFPQPQVKERKINFALTGVYKRLYEDAINKQNKNKKPQIPSGKKSSNNLKAIKDNSFNSLLERLEKYTENSSHKRQKLKELQESSLFGNQFSMLDRSRELAPKEDFFLRLEKYKQMSEEKKNKVIKRELHIRSKKMDQTHIKERIDKLIDWEKERLLKLEMKWEGMKLDKKLVKKAKADYLDERINYFFKWELERIEKIKKMREMKIDKEMEECTFVPKLDIHSVHILKRYKRSKSFDHCDYATTIKKTRNIIFKEGHRHCNDQYNSICYKFNLLSLNMVERNHIL